MKLRDSASSPPVSERNSVVSTKTYASVDTSTTKNMLRKANEAKDMGIQSLNGLQTQAEQLDRIERNLDRIDSNMDTAKKITDGMNSMGGLFNTGSAEKISRNTPINASTGPIKNRKVELDLDNKTVDVNVLQKLRNCNLVPTILRFTNDRFLFANYADKKPMVDTIKSYESLAELTVRLRPQHIDIKFKDGTRYRIVTSFYSRLLVSLV